MNFAADHPNLGLVLYRIGDLLELAGTSKEKIDGAWRECVFRTGEVLGGKLCQARQATRQLNKNNRSEWPKVLAQVEDILKASNLNRFEPIFAQDLALYSRILLAHGFLKAEDPFQAYQQIELTRDLEGSSDLKAWLAEYRVSALAGHLNSKVDGGRATEALAFFDAAKVLKAFDEGRPELIWPLAKAYTDLGLWSKALEEIQKGLQADSQSRPHADRPYLPTVAQWKRLRSQVETRMFLAGDLPAAQVERHLKEVRSEGQDAELLRMWKEFYKAARRPAQEAETLAKLRKVSTLSADEWKRYFEALSEAKQERLLRSELESYAGPWLSASEAKTASDVPRDDIFYMLFEARERQGDFTGAETVLVYLLNRKNPSETLKKEQLLFRQGQLRRKAGRIEEARQSFEAAKALAGDSMWGRLSVSELQSL